MEPCLPHLEYCFDEDTNMKHKDKNTNPHVFRTGFANHMN